MDNGCITRDESRISPSAFGRPHRSELQRGETGVVLPVAPWLAPAIAVRFAASVGPPPGGDIDPAHVGFGVIVVFDESDPAGHVERLPERRAPVTAALELGGDRA